MTAHQDSGLRCLVFHGDGGGQCIECTCGVTVRPREWQAHLDFNRQEDARLKRLARLPEAEKAVIEAAKVMAHQIPISDSYHRWVAAQNGLLAAVATLRELEGEV